uniref:Uncharacterized protein n=1 Tax=Panagrolaimus sp. ES5 TaxID=591445 RepID=A0AC34FI93_9BILA
MFALKNHQFSFVSFFKQSSLVVSQSTTMKAIVFLGLFAAVFAVVSAQNRPQDSSGDSDERRRRECNCAQHLTRIADGSDSNSREHARCRDICGSRVPPSGGMARISRGLGLLGKGGEGAVLHGTSGNWNNGMGSGGRFRPGKPSRRPGHHGNHWGPGSDESSSSSSSSESNEGGYGGRRPGKPGYGGGNNRPGYGNGRPSYGRPSYGRPSYGYSPPSYGYGYNWYPQYQWPAYETPINDVFQGQPAFGWQYSMRSPWGTPRKPISFGYSNGGGYGGGGNGYGNGGGYGRRY